ncbi:hypothetical protein DSO57_1039809 [Entomophthora muscae]|uniref:Uncharacterized protein n=1 Tax=Entomophthora muscae TaxID=34485 RepID=A0ACC2S6Z9_9FUNG|nr:hypothetical protein DSO57_1039809 [Entomophthora muscae]
MHLDGQILVTKVRDVRNDKTLTVVGVYLEPGGTQGSREGWQILLSLDLPDCTLYGGDFNTYTNNQRDTYPFCQRRHPSAHLMEGFLETQGVVETIANKDLDLTKLIRWGYVDGFPVSGARLDHILISGDISEEFTGSQVQVAHISDRHIVYIDWDSGVTQCATQQWVIRLSTFHNHKWKEMIERVILAMTSPQMVPVQSPSDTWLGIKREIHSSTISFQRRQRNNELTTLHALEKEYKEVAKKDILKFNILHCQIKKLQMTIEKRRRTNATYKFQCSFGTSTKDGLCSLAQRQRGSPFTEIDTGCGLKSKDKSVIKKKIQEFYSSLYAHADVDRDALSSLMTEAGPELTQCPPAMLGPLTADITLEETLAVIKESPNGKTPGPDCIPADVYKPIRNMIAPHLTRLFNYVLSSATQFPEGNEVSICLLFKNKGHRSNVKNWRPISLSNADYKLMTRILSNRIMKIADVILHPMQFGFVWGRSIWDNIHMVQNTLQNRVKSNKGYLLFLDMEKAYDCVS